MTNMNHTPSEFVNKYSSIINKYSKELITQISKQPEFGSKIKKGRCKDCFTYLATI